MNYKKEILSVVRRHRDNWISSKDILEEMDIPLEYLFAYLNELEDRKLIKTELRLCENPDSMFEWAYKIDEK